MDLFSRGSPLLFVSIREAPTPISHPILQVTTVHHLTAFKLSLFTKTKGTLDI